MEQCDDEISNLLDDMETDAMVTLAEIKTELNKLGLSPNKEIRNKMMDTFKTQLSTIFEPYVENVSSNPTTISGTEELQTIAKQSETPKSARPIANEDMTVHHSKTITTEPPMNFDNIRFYCFYCQRKTNLAFNTIADVHEHWFTLHMDSYNEKPFLFLVDAFYACGICGEIGVYHDLVKHFKDVHFTKSLVIVDKINRKKCAICDHVDENISGHFQTFHTVIANSNAFNPMILTESFFDELITMNAHKKLKCNQCDKQFDTNDQLEKHYGAEHKNMPSSSKRVFDNKIIYLFCGLCDLKIQFEAYFDHIKMHTFTFNCLHCNYLTAKLDELLEHEATVHNAINVLNEIRLNFAKKLRKIYFQTNIIFTNGLVLVYHNLLRINRKHYTLFKTSITEYLEKMCSSKKLNTHGESNRKSTSSCIDLDAMETITSSDDDCAIAEVSYQNDKELEKQNLLDRNISIYGIPNEYDKNILDIVLELCNKLKLNILADDIRYIDRLGIEKMEVIVYFKSRNIKNRLMKAKWPSDSVILSSNLKISSIDVRHHMTDFYLNMWMVLQTAKQDKVIHSCELSRKGIAVKPNPISVKKYIQTKQQLADIIYGSKNALNLFNELMKD